MMKFSILNCILSKYNNEFISIGAVDTSDLISFTISDISLSFKLSLSNVILFSNLTISKYSSFLMHFSQNVGNFSFNKSKNSI